MKSDRKYTKNMRGKWSLMNWDDDKDVQFHEDTDKAFKPFMEFLSNHYDEEETMNTLGQYMYMFHDEDKTYYKHFGERSYFNVYHDGETEGKLQNWRKWL